MSRRPSKLRSERPLEIKLRLFSKPPKRVPSKTSKLHSRLSMRRPRKPSRKVPESSRPAKKRERVKTMAKMMAKAHADPREAKRKSDHSPLVQLRDTQD